MNVPINLASKPFRRDRPMVVGSVVVILLQVGLLAFLIYVGKSEEGRLAGLREELAAARQDANDLRQEQAKLEDLLRKPENSVVLEHSLFLNMLLQRKGISWTRIFGDLQTVIPHNVRLVSIRPQVDLHNRILLDMVVGAESNEAAIEMLKQLESSPLFGGTMVHASAPPSQTDHLYRYRVSVNYAQKL